MLEPGLARLPHSPAVRRQQWIAGLFLSLMGCGSPTEIVLVVDSSVPEVETFWIRVSAESARCFSVSASEAELPITLGLLPSQSEQSIEVEVAALGSGDALPACTREPVADAIVAQRARARFVPGERRVLFMSLEAGCRGVRCEAELSCRDGLCADLDRETSPWTGVLPRLVDGGTPMDAGRDGGLDGGDRDAGPPADAGPTDAGPPDAGPCDGATPTVALVAAVADTQLSPEMCGTDLCGGTIDYGASSILNVGQSHVIVRFALPIDDALADRVIDARVLLRRERAHPDCTGCAFDGTVEARVMRNDWVQGLGAGRTGAAWCRRNGACEPWGAAGATAPVTDVGSASSVFVPASQDMVELPLSTAELATFAAGSELSIRLGATRAEPPGAMQVVFITSSIEGAATLGGLAPQLRLTYCP